MAKARNHRGLVSSSKLGLLILAVTVASHSLLAATTRANWGYCAPISAFPDAQGFGTTTPGGRGGTIVKVTSLEDSGPGSLRAALERGEPRIIVFEVGGDIELRENIVIDAPYATIAGQTAPLPGVTLKGAGIRITAHDVLIQHLRIRVGDRKDGPSPSNRDGIQILGPEAHHIVLDHLSVSWAIDENISTWYRLNDITISNCIISEALSNSLHEKGPHSKGLLIGDNSKKISVLKNIFAHNVDRNPLIKGGVTVDIVNNLIYNTKRSIVVSNSDNPSYVVVAGNNFIHGPDTPADHPEVTVNSPPLVGSKIFFSDNLTKKGDGVIKAKFATMEPFSPDLGSRYDVLDPEKVERHLLKNAGALPSHRDLVDKRIITEIKTRGGNFIDTPRPGEVKPSKNRYIAKFLIPENPNRDDDGDGYTNIEEVLHKWARQRERIPAP